MQNDDQKRINGNEKRHLGYWKKVRKAYNGS